VTTTEPVAQPTAVPATTLDGTLLPGAPGEGGYHRVTRGPGEPHLPRTDLGGSQPTRQGMRPLLAFVQLSDLHVVDAQSPARAEFLDRLGDPDSPVATTIGPVGGYRPQESLSFHVVEAMARAVGRLQTSPVTGQPISFAISTGDNADNGQRNELDAYISILDGTTVRPDSGSPDRWEGVGSEEWYEVRYWHPDGTPAGEPDDLPRGVRGFPTVPGLLDACRVPFRAAGIGMPWYEVHGNHDELLGGTLPGSAGLAWLARSGRKPVALDGSLDPHQLVALLGDHERQPPDLLGGLGHAVWHTVTPDPARISVGTPGWLAEHTRGGTRAARAHTWYAFDAGRFRCLVLDTVNPNGGWQGSLDVEQFAWLEAELAAGSDRTFLLFSHHPLSTLVNDWSPRGGRRVLAKEVGALLGRHRSVAVWFNGHTHTHKIQAHAPQFHEGQAGTGWWEVTTASHADWPQQARIIELAEDPGTGALVVIATVLDHVGLVDARNAELDDLITLAGWSRELAANHWQRARNANGEPVGRGAEADRNVVLVLPR
jgi:metallophosphoesterase (TIGR03767 family)